MTGEASRACPSRCGSASALFCFYNEGRDGLLVAESPPIRWVAVPVRPGRSSPVPTRAIRGRPLAVAFVLLLPLAACTETLSRVFVPGTAYTETVRAWTEQGDTARVRVGEALVLHAERHSGPWVEVDRGSLDAGACWVARDPGHEEEVAGMIGWYVNPPGAAEFGGFRTDLSADVTFSRPGTYALTPGSNGLCSAPYLGNVLHVIVAP